MAVSAGEPIIAVRDLRFRYPGADRDALAGIDLDVHPGEFLGITGPSGAGKSTLCLCLKGIIPAGAFSGTITIAGREIRPHGSFVDASALVFQNPEVQIIGLTVAEDLAFGPENLRRDPAWIRSAIPHYLRQVRLEGSEEVETYHLSGGQKQRLAIAAALIMEPQILILDEPTAELDPVGRDEVFAVLTRLRTERRVTIVMVEHAAEELAELADRVIVLDQGRIVDQGPPDSLYRNPALFHHPNGERAPQIAEVLYRLERDGLIEPGHFSAREEPGLRVLAELLSAIRLGASHA